MRRPISFAVSLFSCLLAVTAYAGSAPVQVTSCGQAVPRNAHAILMNDLDCTGFTGGLANDAVSLGKGASIDLQGHTIIGSSFGIVCWELCDDGSGACSDSGARCEITNGTITGTASDGIAGDVVTVRNVTLSNNGQGIGGYRKVTVVDSVVTGNGRYGVEATSVVVDGSTITGNAILGVRAGRMNANGQFTHGAAIRNSTVTGNGTLPECGTLGGPSCADISSFRRPKLRHTVCDTTIAPGPVPGCGRHWCVCSIN